MIEPQRKLAARLGDRLPEEWRYAYAANPRHAFLPDRVWRDIGQPLDRTVDPAGWLDHAYGDDSVVTQLHDGAESSEHGYPISSSCSMPSVVFDMLSYLDARPGHRVLEIGTGTGWSTGLLSSRLGDDRVTSVEVDPAVAGTARRNLARLGRFPTVVTGDGADGHPPGAPYDRVVATCSVATVPYPWIAQAVPNAVVLTPWGPTFENSALLRLTVDPAGGRAEGRIIDWATFMRLRAQRSAIIDEPADFRENADRSETELDLADVLGDDARFGIGLRVPDCRLSWDLGGDGFLDTLWLLAPGAWASVRAGTVRQLGTRRLWDEVVAGHRAWMQTGEPGRERYGVTVDATGQSVWLDDPGAPITPVRRACAAGTPARRRSPCG